MTVIGEVLCGNDLGAAVFFSPWFPRGGNRAVFACDLMQHGQMGTFSVTVETKNSGEGDNDGTTLGSAEVIGLGTPKLTTFVRGANLASSNQGMLELVRYRFVVTCALNETLGFVHFRMLEPSWFTN